MTTLAPPAFRAVPQLSELDAADAGRASQRPFFAFNVASTPDPPVVDLGPVIGMYLTVLSVWFVWLGARRAGGKTRRARAWEPLRDRRRTGAWILGSRRDRWSGT